MFAHAALTGGACFVAGVSTKFMNNENLLFEKIKLFNLGQIYKGDTYLIIIPRLLSCFMMHLTCEGEIRNGLDIMKYVANHPMKFRVHYIRED